MAITYYWQDAWNIVCRQIGRQIEDAHAAVICNMALARMWQAYDWKESLETLPPFYLIPYEQDYGPPVFSVPTDFHGFRMTYAVQTTSVPALKYELQVVNNLRATGQCGMPTSIGFDKATKTIRLWPRVPNGLGATDWLIEGNYKKRPTKLTSSTMQGTLLPFDDIYLSAQCAVLKWVGMEIAASPNADAQGALAQALIDMMAENEGLNFGDSVISPREAMWNDGESMGWGGPYIW